MPSARHAGPLDAPSLLNWKRPSEADMRRMRQDVALEMGWGRLLFGQTFGDAADLASALCDERPGRRNIALYVRDPHVVLAMAPQDLFLDPSHTYRLHRDDHDVGELAPGIVVRHLKSRGDADAVVRIMKARSMVPADPDFLEAGEPGRPLVHLVAESEADGSIVGTVTGVDHVAAFDDPEGGSSLWCLAVDPQAPLPGIGEALVRQLAEWMFQRGRAQMDLSVMHDNHGAIGLYEKLGFRRVPAFCVKRKNPINEPLFLPGDSDVNVYARIIVDEARRRGIHVDVLDAQRSLLRLSLGGRSVTCWESLSDLTSALAFVRCNDKRLTHEILQAAGLPVPDQRTAGDREKDEAFLRRHRRVVVKPARGEQGQGVHVDLGTNEAMHAAIEDARRTCPDVVLESYQDGEDLRVIVIGGEAVAAAVRRRPTIEGTGEYTVRELIEKYDRRRRAATQGESRVPLDAETRRCVHDAGFELDDILPTGTSVALRKAANLHTGGTIHDVTERIHPAVADACVAAAQALEIPVVGLDLIVPDLEGPDHVFIEANERPGLANHEPAPTAQRFVDHLFPETAQRP